MALCNDEFRIEIPGPGDFDYAQQVSRLIDTAIESGSPMLPKKPTEVLELFRQRVSVLAVDPSGLDVLAHVAAHYVFDNGDVEIGAMVTAQGRRRKGLAATTTLEIIELTRERFPGQRVIALANETSCQVLEKLGARRMKHVELHPDAWQPCNKCPRKPIPPPGEPFRCCDTPYELTHVYRKNDD